MTDVQDIQYTWFCYITQATRGVVGPECLYFFGGGAPLRHLLITSTFYLGIWILLIQTLFMDPDHSLHSSIEMSKGCEK